MHSQAFSSLWNVLICIIDSRYEKWLFHSNHLLFTPQNKVLIREDFMNYVKVI